MSNNQKQLNQEKAREIRILASQGEKTRTLAEKYGVGMGAITQVLRGDSYPFAGGSFTTIEDRGMEQMLNRRKGSIVHLIRWQKVYEEWVSEGFEGKYCGKDEYYWFVEKDGIVHMLPKNQWNEFEDK